MSNYFNLIVNKNNQLIPNAEALAYLKSIKEKVILIGLISTTNDIQSNSDFIKLSLLSNIITAKEANKNSYAQSISLYLTDLEKENLNTKIFILDINLNNNKHLFSLSFLICSLFVFCLKESLNPEELKKFELINSLLGTIKLKGKTDSEKLAFFRESSPKLLFFIPDSKSYPDFYLEEELSKKENNEEINLIKENISKLFPKKELFSENDEKNKILIEKIIGKANPKEINEKFFDGNSLSFFIEKFCEMHNKKVNPDFDLLFGNLIYNDIQTSKEKAIKYFQDNLNKLENDNEEYLIPKIYEIKIKSIEIYNQTENFNYKVFNNDKYGEYKLSFITMKKDLENKFTELEDKKLIENLKKSEIMCNELLNKYYETINQKIIKMKYNKTNTEQYMKDYQEFINAYEKKAKGNNKIKCLINFLEIHNPKYFKSLLFKENKKSKDNTIISKNDEDYEEIKDELNSKKREIEILKDKIERIKDEINKMQLLENEIDFKQYKSI